MYLMFTPDELQQLQVMAVLLMFTAGFMCFGSGLRH
jgi:hypothetical protein